MKEAAPKVAIYARVSTADGRQETLNQLTQLRDYCERSGLTVAHEYVDQESGGTAKRPAFRRLFADARQRKFDLILFWSLDRFSREGAFETLSHLQRLTSYGVAWKSLTEEYLDSAGIFKDAIIGIMATLAKQERVKISERTKAGLQRARAQGKTLGRPRKILDRSKALRLSAEGHSLASIAKALGVSRTQAHRLVRPPTPK